jgi:LPS export ABC transporter protein LptC
MEEPYTEFPKGLQVYFYDSLQNEIASLRSNYAINKETENIWIAENDVQVVNTKGDTLNTEYLIWDQKKKKIYSEEYVRMTTKDGIIHGKSFEANEDLTDWKIINI